MSAMSQCFAMHPKIPRILRLVLHTISIILAALLFYQLTRLHRDGEARKANLPKIPLIKITIHTEDLNGTLSAVAVVTGLTAAISGICAGVVTFRPLNQVASCAWLFLMIASLLSTTVAAALTVITIKGSVQLTIQPAIAESLMKNIAARSGSLLYKDMKLLIGAVVLTWFIAFILSIHAVMEYFAKRALRTTQAQELELACDMQNITKRDISAPREIITPLDKLQNSNMI